MSPCSHVYGATRRRQTVARPSTFLGSAARPHGPAEAYNTHPSATERQTLSDDVDAKDLEHFLGRQRFLGNILGVRQVERLTLQGDVQSLLFPTGNIWHLPPSTRR